MKRFAGTGAALAVITLFAGASYGQDCTGAMGSRSDDDVGPCWARLPGVTSAYMASLNRELVAAHSSVITSTDDAEAGLVTVVEFTYWRMPDDAYIRCRDLYREDGVRLSGTGSICQLSSPGH
ncbi:hypothetical protein [Maricaulis sp. MIT060901]|uniref:hypothetical protein n=1 Tax=Maricaulis sp. MIT060901 TaxID=3096993 RepID=UPI0039994E58